MAEGILRDRFTRAGTALTVSSMGIHALYDRKPTESAITVCKEAGIDISGIVSRQLIPEELKGCRYIFTMEPVQVDYIDLFFPQVSDRLFMLSTWPQRKSKKLAIADPVGKSLAVHRTVFTKISQYIDQLLPHLLSLSNF